MLSGSAAFSGQLLDYGVWPRGKGEGGGNSKEREEERGERKKESPSSGMDLGNELISRNPIDNIYVQVTSQCPPQTAGEKALYGPESLFCSFHQHTGKVGPKDSRLHLCQERNHLLFCDDSFSIFYPSRGQAPPQPFSQAAGNPPACGSQETALQGPQKAQVSPQMAA